MATRWTADAYEGFYLSDEKKADCKRIAMILVHEALRHYQKFDKSVPREMDSKRWKPIKSSNNVTMYRERNPSQRTVKGSSTNSSGWQMPRVVVGNGSVSSNFDDLLYGLAYGDEAAILQGMKYSGPAVTNCQILSTIEKPTMEHPYRSTCLQWHAGSPSPALRGVIKDRDTVCIRATGVLQVSKDERIGYYIMHSVNLSSTPSLEERGILRSRISTCNFFKPLADQTVEVFIKGYYEAMGNSIIESFAVATLASTLMDSWTSGQCAKRKKLSWLLQRKSVDKDDVMRFVGISEAESRSECRSCKKRFGPLRKAYPCILCDSLICRKCVHQIELYEVISKLKLMAKKFRFCPACDHFTDQVNSYKVARQEIRAGRYEKEGSGSTIVGSSRISQLTESSSDLSGKEFCAGEVYEFESDQLNPSIEGSLNTFAQFTSTTDAARTIEPKQGASSENSAEGDAGNGKAEYDTLVENGWRSSISELDCKDEERDRQLVWLKITELRLRQDDLSSES